MAMGGRGRSQRMVEGLVLRALRQLGDKETAGWVGRYMRGRVGEVGRGEKVLMPPWTETVMRCARTWPHEEGQSVRAMGVGGRPQAARR